MVTHKFSRDGYTDVEFELQIQDNFLFNEILTSRVPQVGARQEPLTTSENTMTITGQLVGDDSLSAEAKAYNLFTMVRFGATVTLQIETDIIRTWEGLSERISFKILAARTNELIFIMLFKVDDYP